MFLLSTASFKLVTLDFLFFIFAFLQVLLEQKSTNVSAKIQLSEEESSQSNNSLQAPLESKSVPEAPEGLQPSSDLGKRKKRCFETLEEHEQKKKARQANMNYLSVVGKLFLVMHV